MLPMEAFAEAVAFLPTFDLSALAVLNAMCSSLAIKASSKIRWEYFADLRFCVHYQRIREFRRTDTSVYESVKSRLQLVADLPFPSESAMTEFVWNAFPNCIFENVTIFCFANHSFLDAIGRIADSVIIKGTLLLEDDISSGEILNVASTFRTLKALELGRITSDDEAKKIANLCRGSGIQELHYYRSYYDELRTKIALV